MMRWSAARVLAPAKINLGLEIHGRRPDGFHEIRSVLAMVDLADEIRIAVAPGQSQIQIAGIPDVAVADNLITRAVTIFSRFTDTTRGYDIHVVKRIPAPAGLGSASSDAAAASTDLATSSGVALPMNSACVESFTASPVAGGRYWS